METVFVDLSHHQARVNFTEYAQGGGVVAMHKATQGVAYVDERFTPRRALAAQVGVLWGGYHFGVGGSGVAQADALLRASAPGDLLALDFEANPGGVDMPAEEAAAFVHRVRAQTGKVPLFYTTAAWARARIPPSVLAELVDCPLWLAHYGATPGTIPAPWGAWVFWQCNDGQVGRAPLTSPGVGACDHNVFSGSPEALRSFWTANARG